MNGPVMVALAGTPASEAALPVAMRIARALGAPLHLVRVFDVPQETISASAGLVGAFDATLELGEHMQRALEALADRVRDAGLRATATLLPGEDVPHALLREARRVDARLLVLATHARGAIGRALLGSVSDRVMRETDRPIVLVPPTAVQAQLPDADDRELQRVLVPLGDSPASERAAEVLLDVPHRDQFEVVLMHAAGAATPADAPPTHAATAALAERLARAGIRTQALTVRAPSSQTKSVADAITRAAQEADADLIVMTTCWHTGLARLRHACTADAVVRTATRPVLLVRAPEQGR